MTLRRITVCWRSSLGSSRQASPEPSSNSTKRREARSPDAVHAIASDGFEGPPSQLPHASRIQASFGSFDVSGIRAHSGDEARAANESLGSIAYASGDRVAFRGTPDLFTAAHEAAHVIQQQAGVQLRDGVGESADPYETHADQVAARVVQGQSAEDLLAEFASLGTGPRITQRKAIQRRALQFTLSRQVTRHQRTACRDRQRCLRPHRSLWTLREPRRSPPSSTRPKTR
ncbi:MAG TPA: DUF4157 domain-containing protein [Myxococcota bacterium]|nr:DUF4157 domain-containing protein [Myxococcota bacterium]